MTQETKLAPEGHAQSARELPDGALLIREVLPSIENHQPAVQADSPDQAASQAEYRKAYFEELRRRSCPGCGEDGPLPVSP